MPWVLALTAPAVVAIVWGTFLSPKRKIDLPKPARVLVELAVFGTAALALVATGRDTLAIVLAVIALLSGALNYVAGEG